MLLIINFVWGSKMKQRSWMVVGLMLVALSQAANLHASENTPAKLTGTDIELFERGHAFAGAVLGSPVFGVFQEDPFGAKVEIRKNNRTLVLNIAEAGNLYVGEIVEKKSTGEELRTTIEYVKITKTAENQATIALKVDGQPLNVSVGAKTFLHGHFQGPQFEAKLGEKTVAFHFTGQSCFGYSINLAMMVYGTYAHLAK